jgi:maltose alpha-D-glucosyltransferase/alpha-amylase
MLDVMKFWLELGVDGFRADAVPYLFEREGTNCENLPESHAYLKELRSYIDQNYPGRILLAEANQWPEDVRLYFGEGDEFHMGFHFPVMPRIYMAVAKGDSGPLKWILDRTPSIPESCQWCIFLRNHDELTLEMVTDEEREWMWGFYAPEPRMRLNLGIRRRLAPLLDNDRRKIELVNSLLFSLPGSPIIYYGDEIGMGDNIWLPDRNGVRTPMQWNDGINAGFSTANPGELFGPVISGDRYGPQQVNVNKLRSDLNSTWQVIRRMIAVRKAYPEFGRGDFIWVDTGNKAVAAYLRTLDERQLLIVNNLSPNLQVVEVMLPDKSLTKTTDLLSNDDGPDIVNGGLAFQVKSYQYLWLQFKKG